MDSEFGFFVAHVFFSQHLRLRTLEKLNKVTVNPFVV